MALRKRGPSLFAMIFKLDHYLLFAFLSLIEPFMVFLFCTPVKRSTGIAGKDSSWTSEFGQRLRFASSHRIPSSTIGSRAGCSGWKTRQRTSLAVQQQRFDHRQQC